MNVSITNGKGSRTRAPNGTGNALGRGHHPVPSTGYAPGVAALPTPTAEEIRGAVQAAVAERGGALMPEYKATLGARDLVRAALICAKSEFPGAALSTAELATIARRSRSRVSFACRDLIALGEVVQVSPGVYTAA